MKNSLNLQNLPWVKFQIKIAVFGDVMLDEYLWGDVKRISPEAPVPVHSVKNTTCTPGGAANVALNIKSSECDVSLFSHVGNDETAEKLKSSLKLLSIDTTGLLVRSDMPTVKKTRIVTSSQQIARIDFEGPKPLSEKDSDRILDDFRVEDFQIVVLSDYNKGYLTAYFCQKILEKCASKNIPVIIDPKSADFTKYSGAFLVTPNYQEACIALGCDESEKPDPVKLANALLDRYKFKNALVTMGSKGMVWASADGKTSTLQALAQEVFDVSGAGDTVLAVMAMSLGAGESFPAAMELANFAASVVVRKRGTQPIFLKEFDKLTNAGGLPSETKNKIMTKEQFVARGRDGKKIVFTNGCFDLLHAGHVDYLEAARARGDMLVVGLNSDESVQRNKGKSRPIIACGQRARVLAALSCIDAVIVFDEDTPLRLIQTIVPDVLVKGADWDKADIVGRDVVENAGGEVDSIQFTPGISTTTIIKRIHDLPKNLQ